MSILNLFNGGSYIDQQIIKTGKHITTSTEYTKGGNTIKHHIDDAGGGPGTPTLMGGGAYPSFSLVARCLR